MKKITKYNRFLLVVVFLVGITFLFNSSASAALVECGNQDGGTASGGCQVKDLFNTAIGIINYLLGAAGVVAVGGVIYGGATIAGSTGNEQKLSAGKKAVTLSLWGLAIVIMSVFIVNAILLTFQAKDAQDILKNPLDFINK